MSAFYEAIGDHQDASQEQAAWLSSVERKKDHWEKLGYSEYKHCLTATDPHGKARNMIDSYKNTVRRKTNAIDTVRECWSASPELLELAAANEGVGKWRSLASLASATDGALVVAKYCLNKALLARLPSQYGKAGRGAANSQASQGPTSWKRGIWLWPWAGRPGHGTASA